MPPKLPVLKAKEVIAALLRAGFYVHHQKEATRGYSTAPSRDST
jgi:predicted RNA binding protein YcfA (HicA-like mRNA interferase family)